MFPQLLLLLLLQYSLAGKILVLNPTIGHSHVRFLGNLASLLADDGHNVTIISANMDSTVEPFGTDNPLVRRIEYNSPYVDPQNWQKIDMKQPTFWKIPPPKGLSMDWTVWETFSETTANVYKGMMEDKEFMKMLADEKFDLGIMEIFEIGSFGIFEVLGIPTSMVAGALGMLNFHYEITGIPFFNSFVPDWLTTFGEEMTFLERLDNFRADVELKNHLRTHLDHLHGIFRTHDPSFPDLREIMMRKTGLILLNTNEFTESPRLRTNMLQYVGGTNVHPPKALPKDIEAILSQRPSTVLFSLGSFVYSCSMPLEMKMEILNAFAQFPEHTFLWKYEECDNDTAPFADFPNVVARPWWPQTDLLGHPKIKAFITHAGMNSMLELAFRGKPAITIPLFADQYINAKNSVARGLSVMLDRTKLTQDVITEALHKILDPDSSIAKRAALAAEVLEGKDEEYRQAVLRWTKLLIRHGPMEHLTLPTTRMSFLQIYSIDVFVFILSVSFISLFLVLYLTRRLLRVLRKSSQKEKSA